MITLSAITGNEEALIERFIRSFAPAVDEFVFVRAIGNQKPDATFDIAERVCNELHKPVTLEVYRNREDWPHVDDYSDARNLSLEIALCEIADDGDYVIWSDIDDTLADGAAEAIRTAAADGTHEVFLMPYHVRGDKQVVMRERMFKACTMPKWIHAVHEQIRFGREVSYRIVKDAIFNHSPNPGKDSHPRNVRILQNQIKDAGRNFFYLSQQYFQSQEHEKFVQIATAALNCPTLDDLEKYELHVQLAQTPHQDSRAHAALAFAIMPDRREALALLASYCIIDGDHEKALCLAERMIATPKPTKTYWSQNNEWYGWKGKSLHAQCLRLAGKPQIRETQEILGRDGEVSITAYFNPPTPTFSIIHATLGRPEQALAIREMWLGSARNPDAVEYIFGLHHDDEKSIAMLKGFPHTITDQKGPGWNYDTAAGAATGQIIIQAQDDCYPPDGWDAALLEMIPDPSKPVFVAVGDGHRTDRLCVNTVMTAAYMRAKAERDPGENGFFHRGYPTVYPDTENSFRAIEDAKAGIVEYIDAPQFVIYHDHPYYNPGVPFDATYQLENHPDNYVAGAKLFAERNPTATAQSLERGIE